MKTLINKQLMVSFSLENLKTVVANKKDLSNKQIKFYERSKDIRIWYLLGMYYEEKEKSKLALKKFIDCIKKDHRFTPPYTQILNYTQDPDYLNELYNRIILKKTYVDLFENEKQKVDLNTSCFYTEILHKHLKFNKREKLDQILLKRVVEGIENYPNIKTELDVEILTKWKTFVHYLIQTYRFEKDKFDFYTRKCFDSELNNIPVRLTTEQKHKINLIEKNIVRSYYLISQYHNEEDKQFCDMDKLYNTQTFSGEKYNNEKIRIGYISPDFKTNATMFHTTTLLKYYNRDKFEIYCYSLCDKQDNLTEMFKSYTDNFFNINKLTTEMRCTLIKRHKIDILVDLIALGGNADVDLIALAPAPIIINYIGYPGSGLLKSFTHRITDKKVDKKEVGFYSEKLIYMPRCFLCWRLPEALNEVPISFHRFNKLRVGVMNRALKQSKETIEMFKNVLEKREDIIFCIKIDYENDKLVYKSLPQEKIIYLYRTETQEEYLDLFNYFDVLVDSYPYSGTTTTNNGLYMGIPTFCLYNENWHHVSNVSAGIMKNMGEEYTKFVCKNSDELVEKVVNFNEKVDQEYREKVRKDFNELMDPKKFMEEYEELIISTFNLKN